MIQRMSLVVLLVLIGCDDGSSKEAASTPDAATADQPPPPPPADVDVEMPEPAKGDVIQVDKAASSILFTGAKVTGSHDGGFEKFDGHVVLSDDEVVGAQFTIDLGSTTSDAPKLTKHLLSKDFFHAEKYPQAVFISSEVKAAAEPGAVTHDVRGVLDFHGRQRPLSFPASVNVGETVTTVSATFDINRQNWGIAYPGKPDNLIKDDVQIRLNLSFPSSPADDGSTKEAAEVEAVTPEAAAGEGEAAE